MAEHGDPDLVDRFVESQSSESSSTSLGKRAAVWDFFDCVSDKQAVCLLCLTSIVHCGNTTNLNRHMKKSHPGKLNPKPEGDQPLITSFTCSESRQEEINNDIAEWIALDGLPLSTIESERFRYILTKHIPGYKPVCRKTFYSKYILPMYTRTFLKIKNVFKDAYYSLTSDGWKARTTEPFYLLTFHSIKDFKLYNLTLTCSYFDEKTTSENITFFLTSSLAEYGFDIDKCISVTRDNAPNMNAAFRDLSLVNFPCTDHSLNLVGKAIIYDKKFSDCIQQVNDVRKKFSYNHECNQLLKSEQIKNGLKPKLFPKEVETRWWSMQKAIEFFVINKKAIDSCLTNAEFFKKKRERIVIKPETFVVAYSLSVICKPLCDASIEFEREDCPTISSILPFLHQMEKLLANKSSTKIAGKLMEILQDQLDEFEEAKDFDRFEKLVQSVIDAAHTQILKLKASYHERFLETLEWATYLDPGFRGTDSISIERQEVLRNDLIEQLKEMEPSPSEPLPPPPKKSKKSFLIGRTGIKTLPGPEKAETEVRNYVFGM